MIDEILTWRPHRRRTFNGTKMWITGAVQADYFLTACRTENGEGKHEGISLLLIPRNTPGVTVTPIDLLDGHMVFGGTNEILRNVVARELLS